MLEKRPIQISGMGRFLKLMIRYQGKPNIEGHKQKRSYLTWHFYHSKITSFSDIMVWRDLI